MGVLAGTPLVSSTLILDEEGRPTRVKSLLFYLPQCFIKDNPDRRRQIERSHRMIGHGNRKRPLPVCPQQILRQAASLASKHKTIAPSILERCIRALGFRGEVK